MLHPQYYMLHRVVAHQNNRKDFRKMGRRSATSKAAFTRASLLNRTSLGLFSGLSNTLDVEDEDESSDDELVYIRMDNEEDVSNFLLKWKEPVLFTKRGSCVGDSRGTKTLDTYLGRVERPGVEVEKVVMKSYTSRMNHSRSQLHNRLDEITAILKSKDSEFTILSLLQYTSISKYIECLLHGDLKIRANEVASESLPKSCTRYWDMGEDLYTMWKTSRFETRKTPEN